MTKLSFWRVSVVSLASALFTMSVLPSTEVQAQTAELRVDLPSIAWQTFHRATAVCAVEDDNSLITTATSELGVFFRIARLVSAGSSQGAVSYDLFNANNEFVQSCTVRVNGLTAMVLSPVDSAAQEGPFIAETFNSTCLSERVSPDNFSTGFVVVTFRGKIDDGHIGITSAFSRPIAGGAQTFARLFCGGTGVTEVTIPFTVQ